MYIAKLHTVTSTVFCNNGISLCNKKLNSSYNEFDVHATVHLGKFLIIKLTRCTNFSNLFLEWNCTCFGQFLCPSSGVFHCTHSNGICYTGLLCAQWKTPDDGHRSCPKHVEFHFKNKFEKSVHLLNICGSVHHAFVVK